MLLMLEPWEGGFGCEDLAALLRLVLFGLAIRLLPPPLPSW